MSNRTTSRIRRATSIAEINLIREDATAGKFGPAWRPDVFDRKLVELNPNLAKQFNLTLPAGAKAKTKARKAKGATKVADRAVREFAELKPQDVQVTLEDGTTAVVTFNKVESSTTKRHGTKTYVHGVMGEQAIRLTSQQFDKLQAGERIMAFGPEGRVGKLIRA